MCAWGFWIFISTGFRIKYEPRTTIEAKALADFLAEMVDREPQEPRWILYVDGASSSKGSGARVIFKKEGNIIVELSIKFDFFVSNNQAKYEALVAELRIVNDIGASRLTICSDS